MISLLLGVVCLVALVRFELTRERPLVDFRLLAERHFRTMNLVGLSVYGGFISLIYVLPIYLQSYLGISATQSGATQVPQAFGVFLVSNLVARRAYNRYGARLILGFGALAGALISGLFVFVGDDANLWVLRAGTLARGLAMGFIFVTIQTAAYATTSMANTGRAVSIFTTQRQMASALGTAVVATSLTSALNNDLGLTAYRVAFGVGALLFVPAIVWGFRVREADVANTRTVAARTG
jgi:fucose permease